MEQLSPARRKPSSGRRPSAGSLGGVAEKTREALLVCEAAGFDVIIVETVGVGQSETAVAGMTDVFVLLQLPNAGDDLQAIKKGIVETRRPRRLQQGRPRSAGAARSPAHQMRNGADDAAPRLAQLAAAGAALSARSTSEGIAEFWHEVERYRATMTPTGEFAAKRRHQALRLDVAADRLRPAPALPRTTRGVRGTTLPGPDPAAVERAARTTPGRRRRMRCCD